MDRDELIATLVLHGWMPIRVKRGVTSLHFLLNHQTQQYMWRQGSTMQTGHNLTRKYTETDWGTVYEVALKAYYNYVFGN